jgi:hypothetical protein
MILLETIEERHVIDARLESIGRLFTELMDVLERKDIVKYFVADCNKPFGVPILILHRMCSYNQDHGAGCVPVNSSLKFLQVITKTK